MKTKYLIALDLDGTLLTDQKTITPRTRAFFNKLHNDGHHVVIATGRPLRAAQSFQKQLNINGPLVTHNGVYASSPDDLTFPKHRVFFDAKTLHALVTNIGYERLQNLMVETEKTVYLLYKDEDLNDFFWNDRGNIKYGDPFVNLRENPLTLLFIFKELKNNDRQEIAHIIETHSPYKIRFWGNSMIAELYQQYGSKKEGVEHVAKVLNIARENVIACGDYYNDAEMLKWAGHSILMKNGHPSLRPHVKYVTKKDNNNDGLIKPIKRILRK